MTMESDIEDLANLADIAEEIEQIDRILEATAPGGLRAMTLDQLAAQAVQEAGFTLRDLNLIRATRRRIGPDRKEAAARFREAWKTIAETGRFEYEETVAAIGRAARRRAGIGG
jgi:hypothetical protein